MNVCDLKLNERAVVEKVEAPDALKERLRYLDVYAGADILLLKISFRKKTYLLQAGSCKLAVSREVAEGIICRT